MGFIESPVLKPSLIWSNGSKKFIRNDDMEHNEDIVEKNWVRVFTAGYRTFSMDL